MTRALSKLSTDHKQRRANRTNGVNDKETSLCTFGIDARAREVGSHCNTRYSAHTLVLDV